MTDEELDEIRRDLALLAAGDMTQNEFFDCFSAKVPRLLAEVDRLKEENAELRRKVPKPDEWREWAGM